LTPSSRAAASVLPLRAVARKNFRSPQSYIPYSAIMQNGSARASTDDFNRFGPHCNSAFEWGRVHVNREERLECADDGISFCWRRWQRRRCLLWGQQWNQPAVLQQRPHPSRISRAYGDAIGFFWTPSASGSHHVLLDMSEHVANSLERPLLCLCQRLYHSALKGKKRAANS
jgi:hypothetical protein